MGKQMKSWHFVNELLTEASAAGEEGLVEVLVVDGDGLHQGGGERQHLCLKQKQLIIKSEWIFSLCILAFNKELGISQAG